MSHDVVWPDGKAFAFTVFDDTDLSTIENVGDVYALLRDLGFRTTKSVWPIAGRGEARAGGATCEDPAYLDWVLGLQRDGFEIGLHNATYHSSTREETVRALDAFRRMFGHDPRTLADHRGNAESLYWGRRRLSGVHAALYNALRSGDAYAGEEEDSPYFWGDLCRERVRYVRRFTCAEVDTLAFWPKLPFHDPERPYVNAWFVATEGPDYRRFVDVLDEAGQDELAANGGACLIYTHFGLGFRDGGRLQSRFVELMQRLSRMNGWFVPVHELLDHLAGERGPVSLDREERMRLERRWLLGKARSVFARKLGA